jgi:photosystem II stability/assembly factor-like uncharacterized protein
MVKKKFILIILALFCSLPGTAKPEASFEGTQNGILRNSFELFGAQIEDVAVDSSGRVYAAANAPNGIFCLENGSTTWTDPPAGSDLGNIRNIALGSTAGTAFVVGGIQAFRTTDGCQTWTQLKGTKEGHDDFGFQISYGHGTLLIQNRDGTLDRSTDNGATFTRITVVSGAQEITGIAASPTSGEFYAFVKKDNLVTLYRSTNSGADWTPTGKSGDYVYVAVDPENSLRVAITTGQGDVELSTDGGNSFQIINAPASSKRKLVFNHGRIYKGNVYTDDAVHWSLLNKTLTGADIMGPVAGLTTDASILYAATTLGIGKSTDTGSTFTDSINGMYAVGVHDIAQAADKNIVFLGTEQGLAKTTTFLAESGPTWTLPVIVNPNHPYTAIYSIHIDNSDQNRIYVGTSNGEIYYSSDAGINWTAATVESNLDAEISAIAETSDGTLYAAYSARGPVARGGVLRSSDKGVNWAVISTSHVDINCNTILAVDNTIFVGAGNDQDQNNSANGMYRFDGTTWSKVILPADGQLIMSIASSGNVLLAASAADSDQNGSVFRSKDKGITWTDVTAKGLRTGGGWYRTLAVDFKNPDIIYAAHGRPAGTAEMYYSQDRGENWSLLYTGLIDEVPEVMLVDGLTVGSGVGFTGIAPRKSVNVKVLINKRNALCTLTDAGNFLRSQQVSLEIKKGPVFTRFQTKTTSEKGKVTFNLKKVKSGAKVRARFLTEVSKTKKN